MRNPSKSAAVLAAALFLAGQAGWALAAESESKAKQQGASAQSQTKAQVSVTPAQVAAHQPTAEEIQKNFQTMAPMMGQMMTIMLENMAKKLSEPQIAGYYAAFMRNYYTALIKEGFTEDQALKIVTSTGLPATNQRQ